MRTTLRSRRIRILGREHKRTLVPFAAGLTAPARLFTEEHNEDYPLCFPYHKWYTSHVSERGCQQPVLSVVFYVTASGNEPVRDWLLELARDDRRAVGVDIKTAQYGWPLGMPLIRKLEPAIWEVRSDLVDGIARVLFTVDGDTMVLLHGFAKKSQKASAKDLKTARQRLADLRRR